MKITGVTGKVPPPKLPEWMDRRTRVLLLVAGIFLFTLAFSEPLQQPPMKHLNAQASIATPSPESTSSMPPEWEKNSEQTNGILLGGVVLVMIIIIGSYSVMKRKPHPSD